MNQVPDITRSMFFAVLVLICMSIFAFIILNPKTDYFIKADVPVISYVSEYNSFYKEENVSDFKKGDIVKIQKGYVINGELYYQVREKTLGKKARVGLVKPEDIEKRFKDTSEGTTSEVPEQKILYYGEITANQPLLDDEIVFFDYDIP